MPQPGIDGTTASLLRTVEELKDKVLHLEHKLHVLHATDVQALRRAHRALVQHIQQLGAEAEGLQELVAELRTDVFTQDDMAALASQGTATAILTAVAYNVVRLEPLVRLPWLGPVVLVAAAGFAGWRLITHGCTRLASVLNVNRSAKQQLLAAWCQAQERIDILTALAQWEPALLPLAQDQGHTAVNIAALPSAPPLPPSHEAFLPH